jgi:NADH-quinone oxidoreductase subunit L
MFVAAGFGAYSVAMFHLLTHAFFKAMLFLGAGSVIHAMHHEQDMRNYGGLRKKIPLTFYAMLIGTLAITGVGIPLLYVGFPIGFAGFVSKDAIIEVAYAGGGFGFAFIALSIAAIFTSFYSWRLMFLTFFGAPRGDRHTHEHAHESPKTMTVPLGVLAVGSVLAGMVFYGPFFGSQSSVDRFFGIPVTTSQEHAEIGLTEGGHGDEAAEVVAAVPAEGGAVAVVETHGEEAAHGEMDRALQVPGQGAIFVGPENHIIHEAHEVPAWVKLSPFLEMLIGLGFAWLFYLRAPALPGAWASAAPSVHRFLLQKWYFDEIYQVLWVNPARYLGGLFWRRGDGNVIDGSINGLAMGVIPYLTRALNRAQSGYIFTYAFTMVLGVVALVTWMTIAAAN